MSSRDHRELSVLYGLILLLTRMALACSIIMGMRGYSCMASSSNQILMEIEKFLTDAVLKSGCLNFRALRDITGKGCHECRPKTAESQDLQSETWLPKPNLPLEHDQVYSRLVECDQFSLCSLCPLWLKFWG